jgi:hypothetical protein
MSQKHLTRKELEAIHLIKWPGCDVDGSAVTVEQAMEILVRTNGVYFCTKDNEIGISREKWKKVCDYVANIMTSK